MGVECYRSDLSDKEWELLSPILVKKKRRGPKSRTDLATVFRTISQADFCIIS